tara:strand:+ start:476 stop:607 length:132 start_codon:yes stop_codon:yes gene_type:complete
MIIPLFWKTGCRLKFDVKPDSMVFVSLAPNFWTVWPSTIKYSY